MTKPSIETLVSDIERLLTDGAVSEEKLLEEYGRKVAQNLAESLAQPLTPRVPRLRLSAVGKPSRQLHYELTGAPREAYSAAVLMKFQYGHILEELILYLAKEAGHEVTHEQREVTVDGITGHIDAIIDGYVIDVKSASPYGFLKFKDGSIRDNDGFNYIPQLASYYQALKEEVDGGGFLAINKVSGQLALCLFTKDELRATNVSGHITRQKRVQTNLVRVPERCFEAIPEGKSGNMGLSIGCAYCPFKHHCWRDSNGGAGLRTFIYSNGPKYLTNVAREPKVFEAPPPE